METSRTDDPITLRIPRGVFRFGLKALFLAMTVAAIAAGCWSWHLRSVWGTPFALDGYCPVTLCESRRWQLGDPQHQAIYEGRRYQFVNDSAKLRFEAVPTIYSPVASGCDIVAAMDDGVLVEGNRESGVWYENRVYLFADEANLDRFNRDPKMYRALVPTFESKFAGHEKFVRRNTGSRTFILSR